MPHETSAPARLFPLLWGYNAKEQMAELRTAGVVFLPVGLPWAMLTPHEKQAERNHSQTLRRLAERGGLGPSEALAVLDDRRWHNMPLAVACAELCRRISAWQEGEISNVTEQNEQATTDRSTDLT